MYANDLKKRYLPTEMKFSRSISLAFFFSLPLMVAGQRRFTPHATPVNYSVFANDEQITPSRNQWSLPGLTADKQSNYKPARPYMALPVNTNALMGDSYWMGSVTTQSYNQGKIGRFYYWDVQGNLRGSLLFLDIAGKNKRGLKLVFPRHRGIY